MEEAAAVLLNISISVREQLMSEPDILNTLIADMRAEEYAAVHDAASLLRVDAYRPIVGAKRPIVDMRMVLYPLNQVVLVELGFVRALFTLMMTDERTGVSEDATTIFTQVAGRHACGRGSSYPATSVVSKSSPMMTCRA
jgi:hypothetical protein